MVRKANFKIYLVAGIISLLIFSLGLTLGIITDNERFRWVETANREQEVEYQSLQFQSMYISSLKVDNESCAVISAAIEDVLSDYGYSLEKLQQYQKDSNMNQKDYEILQRKFVIDNLRYWLLAEKMKDICDTDSVNILYFYSSKNCDICPSQGVLLTYYKKKLNDKLLVYPIDLDLEDKEPLISLLRRQYKIYSSPTLIIEGKKYEGLKEKEDLGNIICGNYKNPPTDCIQ